MQEIKKRVYASRETLYTDCFESLGFHVWSRTRESDTSPQIDILFRREAEETQKEISLRRKCEDILDEIKAIDDKADLYYLKRVVLVGMAGAGCMGLSFLFRYFHMQVVFTLLLLLGILGCTVTLTLRPLFTGMGLKKYGADLPELERRLRELMEDTDEEGAE